MPLRERLEKQGNWLFRRRSYLPLLILPLLIMGLRSPGYLEGFRDSYIEDLYRYFCIGLSFLGLLIRIITVGHTPKGPRPFTSWAIALWDWSPGGCGAREHSGPARSSVTSPRLSSLSTGFSPRPCPLSLPSFASWH